MSLPNLSYEQEFWEKKFLVIGVDEVGRGAFAGPLFAAGVIFDPTMTQDLRAKLQSYGINDSKKLTAGKRILLNKVIRKEALAFYISQIDVAEINRIGIGKATFQCMRKIVKELTLKCRPELVWGSQKKILKRVQDRKIFVLVDGFRIKNFAGFEKNQKAIIHGDCISLSIAAASIIAKVARDNYMKKLSVEYVDYNWGQNKGYGTLFHRQVLNELGPTVHHRTQFIFNSISNNQ